jgi:hypothetical protein
MRAAPRATGAVVVRLFIIGSNQSQLAKAIRWITDSDEIDGAVVTMLPYHDLPNAPPALVFPEHTGVPVIATPRYRYCDPETWSAPRKGAGFDYEAVDGYPGHITSAMRHADIVFIDVKDLAYEAIPYFTLALAQAVREHNPWCDIRSHGTDPSRLHFISSKQPLQSRSFAHRARADKGIDARITYNYSLNAGYYLERAVSAAGIDTTDVPRDPLLLPMLRAISDSDGMMIDDFQHWSGTGAFTATDEDSTYVRDKNGFIQTRMPALFPNRHRHQSAYRYLVENDFITLAANPGHRQIARATPRAETLLRFVHPAVSDLDLPFRLLSWTRQNAADPVLDAYILDAYGKQHDHLAELGVIEPRTIPDHPAKTGKSK